MEKAAFPGGSKTNILNFLDTEDGIAVDWKCVSRKADGTEVVYDGLTTLQIRGGKIVAGQDYLDLAPILELF